MISKKSLELQTILFTHVYRNNTADNESWSQEFKESLTMYSKEIFDYCNHDPVEEKLARLRILLDAMSTIKSIVKISNNKHWLFPGLEEVKNLVQEVQDEMFVEYEKCGTHKYRISKSMTNEN